MTRDLTSMQDALDRLLFFESPMTATMLRNSHVAFCPQQGEKPRSREIWYRVAEVLPGLDQFFKSFEAVFDVPPLEAVFPCTREFTRLVRDEIVVAVDGFSRASSHNSFCRLGNLKCKMKNIKK